MLTTNTSRLLASAAIATIATTSWTAVSFAQQLDNELEEIVVTASRVVRPGYDAPTPTTILSMSELSDRGITNVADLLQTVPSFNGSSTRSAATVFSGGQSVLNLRSLGAIRTLVLVDGTRIVPASNTGTFDLNLLPTIAIERSEVVTGGASAAYGADAVAGVVNFITRRNFTGFEAQTRAGISQYGDDKNISGSFIWGTDADNGRMHVVIAGEYENDRGVGDQTERDWSARNRQLEVLGGVTKLVDGGNFTFARPGGMLLGPPTNIGPHTAFKADGTPYVADLGSPEGVGGDSPLGYFTRILPLSAPVERGSSMVNLGYDVSETLKATVGLMYGHVESQHYTVPYIGVVPVQPDNAFLPTGVTLRMPYSLGKIGGGIDYSTRDASNTYSARLKLEGEIADEWTWDIQGQYGYNKNVVRGLNIVETAKFQKAIDAVRNSSGQIVCRVNQTAVTDAACVPFNIFGVNQFTDAAYDYVTGNSFLATEFKRSNFAANLQGSPFATWAGEVSLAAGYEFHRDDVQQSVDAVSAAGGWDIRNNVPVSGVINVHEVYSEVVVPLLADSSVAKAVDFNAAVRNAWYNPGETATTWKTGVTWQIDDLFRVRSTISRDIRAPNVSELYSGGSVGTAPIEPGVYNVSGQPPLVQSLQGGDLSLEPEKAITKSVGFAITPKNAHLSVDFYSIKLTGAIDSPGTIAAIVNGCARGDKDMCARLTLSGGAFGTGVITRVDQRLANMGTRLARGIDFDAGYRFYLDDGKLDFSLLGTYTMDRKENGIDFAGVGGGGYIHESSFATPTWLLSASVNYKTDDWGVVLASNYVSRSKTDPLATSTTNAATVGQVNIEHYPARIYFNLSGTYDITDQFSAFGGIENLLNTDPPAALPFGTFGGRYGAAYYDSIGRRFFLGARFKY